MKLADIDTDLGVLESYVAIFGKSGNKVVRKYRCTSGSKKGRIVAKPATCTTPINVRKSKTLARTKASKGSSIKAKTKITKRSNPSSIRIRKSNRAMGPRRSSRKKFKRF